MKKILLIAFLFNLTLFSVAADNLFLDNSKIDFYTNWNKSPVIGGKLILPLFEFRFYEKSEDKSISYGSEINTAPLFPSVPIQIKAGKLSYSGSYSKLNNPALSSTLSPYFSVQKETSVITAQIPYASNYTKNDSLFLEFDKNNPHNLLQKLTVNGFLQSHFTSDNLQFYGGGSALLKLRLSKNTKLSFSYTSGLFPYESPELQSWFSNIKYYKNGFHWCQEIQSSLNAKNFSGLLTVNCYISPFNQTCCLFRYEQFLKIGKTCLNTALFYNYTDNLLTVNKTLNSDFMFKTGIKKTNSFFWNKPVLFTSGITALYEMNYFENLQTIKISAGTKITTDISNLGVIISSEGIFTQADRDFSFSVDSFSTKLNYSVFIICVKPNLNLSFQAEPLSSGDWKTIEKLKIGLMLPAEPKISVNGQLQLTQSPASENKINYSLICNFAHNIPFAKLNLSCSFDF